MIDQEPIRHSLMRELRDLKRKFEKLSDEVEHHMTHVRPAFKQWYFGRFGSKLSLIQSLREEHDEKLGLLRRMQDLYSWRGFTRKRAFDQASDEVEKFKAREEAEELAAQAKAEEARRRREEEEAQADSSSNESDREWSNFHYKRLEAMYTEKREDADKTIKHYYRKLAQALHPDLNGQMTPTQRDLWELTQAAYNDRDLVRLKTLWTECIVHLDPNSSELRFADLSEVIQKFKTKIHEKTKERRELSKDDPAWRFEKRDQIELAKEISAEIFHAEVELKAVVRELDREIRAFSGVKHGARPSSSSHSRRGSSRPSSNSSRPDSPDWTDDPQMSF